MWKPLNLAYAWGECKSKQWDDIFIYQIDKDLKKMRMPNTGKDTGHLTLSYIAGDLRCEKIAVTC